jgi:putative intracellular protease/amidase
VPVPWLLSCGAAALTVLHVVLGLAIVGPAAVGPWPLFVVTAPSSWLLVAGWLARHDTTAGRHAVSFAGLTVLLVQGANLAVLLTTRGGQPLSPWLDWARPLTVASHWVSGPAVFTALAPAAVGWWQRRRERLAADDPDA